MLSDAEIGTNYLQTEPYTNIYYPSLLYYKLKETNETTVVAYLADSSLHGGTTGTYIVDTGNDVNWTNNQVGTPGTALHFHGDTTCIDTSNSIIFNFTTNLFTVNFWTDPYTGGKTLFDNNRGGTNGWSITYDSGRIIFSDAYNSIESDAIVNILNWNMVTVMRNSSNQACIYINGQLSANGVFSDITSSSDSLRIGGGVDNGVIANGYDGDVWGIQIWGQPLQPVDIANLWFRQKDGNNWP
jgi:hypothetical protein